MPVIFLERLPLPSLRVYITLTVALTSCSFYYSYKSVTETAWKANSTSLGSLEVLDSALNALKLNNSYVNFSDIIYFMVQDPFCIWTLLNCGYCCLLLVGKLIQQLVFGDLRVSESQHLKDKLWNFVFYKFIFVFGVINVQYMDEVLMWCAWFALLGSLHLLAQLCKDRFEYLSFSSSNSPWSHIPLVALLGVLMVSSSVMLSISIVVGMNWGLSSFAFMGAECVLLNVCLIHTLLRYILHLYEVQGDVRGKVWEKRGCLAYYTELCLELSALVIELAHHLHMLLWSNIFLSMASLVICMHIRFLIEEIRRRIRKHRNYLWVLYHMEQSYPMASEEEIAENSDHCAICWEKLECARKLPCKHLFHNGCLQSWLEQDTSCPTCRMALSMHNRDPNVHFNGDHHHNRTRPNHFFHFDGSRYVSWLPSFSVEVIHTQIIRASNAQQNHNSQLDAMARQVQQLFQHFPLPIIITDLQVTRSVELTIGNILDGRLIAPQTNSDFEQEPLMSPVSTTDVQHDWNPATVTRYSSSNENYDEDENTIEHEREFSEWPAERERNLSLRKEKLMSSARRRYLERLSQNS